MNQAPDRTNMLTQQNYPRSSVQEIICLVVQKKIILKTSSYEEFFAEIRLDPKRAERNKEGTPVLGSSIPVLDLKVKRE